MKISKPNGYWVIGLIILLISSLSYLGGKAGTTKSVEKIETNQSETLNRYDEPDAIANQSTLNYKDKRFTNSDYKLFKSVTTVIDSASIVDFQLSDQELESIELSVFEFKILMNEILEKRAIVEKHGSNRLIKIVGDTAVADQLRAKFDSNIESKIGKTRWEEIKTGMPFKSIEKILDHWGKYPIVFRVEPPVRVTDDYSTVAFEKTTGGQSTWLNYTYGLPYLRAVYGDFASTLIGK
tara:strand:+ start:930 stop:1643 length:714 start_codon:yes stop_codon:yes gene_type:complete